MGETSKAEQDKLFHSTGIQYSELLRLPYFDPVLMISPDSMHALYLGLVHDLVSVVWGMDANKGDLDGADQLPVVADLDELQQVHHYLNSGNYDDLGAMPMEYLYRLCFECGLQWPLKNRTKGRKEILHILIQSVHSRGFYYTAIRN